MSETSITWVSEERRWKVWTDNTAHAARIERTFGIAPYRVDSQEGYPDGKFYLLPEGRYSPFAAKRIVNLTDEQRAAMRERFQRQAGQGESAAISSDGAEIDETYLDDDSDDSSEVTA